jgi:hypothetical protein
MINGEMKMKNGEMINGEMINEMINEKWGNDK